MQNANVNFANTPTLMSKSPWLTEKEQKAHLMSLGVLQGAYLWIQWVVTNGDAVTVFTDNTKVVSNSGGQYVEL